MPNITIKNAYRTISKHKNDIFTKSFIESKLVIWESADYMKQYPIQEIFLDNFFAEQKSKNDYYNIFIRVKILDSFYSTNLKEGINVMVENIMNIKNFIKRVNNGDTEIVNDISKVNSTKFGLKNSTSFASKYCSRYNSKKFPIYDKYVRQMLVLINKVTNFNESKFALSTIYDYKQYCCVVNKFVNMFNNKNTEAKMDYKIFDRYIWTWAKEILHDIADN